MKELHAKNLPMTALHTWKEHIVESYPALDCQKKIYSLVYKLWQKRDQIAAKILQVPPYEVHFSPDRLKEQVILLI